MTASSGREVHGLAFLILASFVTSFLAARVFTTFFPTAVVVAGGIHFHHFWYGLAMVVASGWLSLVSNRPRYDRIYAIVFGLGAGLIGDEVGLLLTFGNYQSELTYAFFVVVLSFAGIAYLLTRYRLQIEAGVLSLGTGERLAHLGVVVAGLSALFWAFGLTVPGLVVLSAGAAASIAGLALHLRAAR